MIGDLLQCYDQPVFNPIIMPMAAATNVSWILILLAMKSNIQRKKNFYSATSNALSLRGLLITVRIDSFLTKVWCHTKSHHDPDQFTSMISHQNLLQFYPDPLTRYTYDDFMSPW